ncbi:MAG: hypothetical protein DRP71_11365 [Verrucomicrobia bacterium]|nr:MAG: hypothetical protein DRP71_11365 [Verrucomicrobiota bacterium]
MRRIKLHLEVEEYEPLHRLASELGVRPEVIIYTGLDEIMKRAREEAVRERIIEIRDMRRSSLPAWADHAHEVHAYESM